MSDRLSGISATTSTTRFVSGAIKVIDVSEKPAQANVVREGKLVPAVTTNATALQNWLNLGVIRPVEDLRRVVSQTIPAGTRVARGVAVDLLLAEARLIPLDVLDRPHRGLVDRGFTVQSIADDFLGDAEIRNAILDASTPEALSPASQQRIRNAFTQRDLTVDDGDPARDFNSAFRTLKSAAAFR